jgi:aminopeptidase
MRGQFGRVTYGKTGARHAHTPSITPAIMREGLRVDFHLVSEMTSAVHEAVREAQVIHMQLARGSDLRGRFTGRHKWVACRGPYHNPGEGGNLPEGEVYTCPDSAEGVPVADVVGDHFASKYGLLDDPVLIEIEAGYARHVQCANPALEQELLVYSSPAKNGLGVGEFTIGTNIGIKSLRGNMLQEERIPGLHLALGYLYGYLTGADWTCNTHVDFVLSACSITVGGKHLMREGRFTFETQPTDPVPPAP